MMKMANMKVEKMPKSSQARFYCQIEWLFGLLLLIINILLNMLALTLGSILLIASTSCATIVFNGILAPLLLNEKFKIFPDGCTVLLLSIGSTLAAF